MIKEEKVMIFTINFYFNYFEIMQTFIKKYLKFR